MRVFKRVLATIVMLALLAFPVLVYVNAQALVDWWQLRGYNPSVAVSSLVTKDTMTAYAQHVFYVNRPNIESDAGQFRADCHETEKTIVLGCYHSNQDGIFLYNVQEPRLDGVQQVTAAHEMLHAAYDRLSSKDKKTVNSLLQNYFINNLHDQRIIDTMKAYQQTEPNEVVNEMHSVFGTEIANLPAPLETYYKKYFVDRQAVVNFAGLYQGEFTSREDQIKADAAQLEAMKASINAQEASLNVQLDRLNSDRAHLSSLRSSGQIDQYNAAVPGFNNEVSAYNAGIRRLQGNISAYNQLVLEYNATAKELASLQQALDTRLTTQSTQ